MQSIQYLWLKAVSLVDNFSVAPTYIQAGAIVILLFLLVLSLAQFRHHFVQGSLKGGVVGFVFGLIFTLILEGFLLVNGKTAIISMLGWDNAPKPISTALEIGKAKLTNVLGLSTVSVSSKDVINSIQSLNPSEISKIKTIICTP